MQASRMGIATTAFIAVFPFLVATDLFYGAANLKVFATILFTNGMVLWAAIRFWREGLVLPKSLIVASSIAVLSALYLSSFFAAYPALSLWSTLWHSTGVIFLTHLALLAVVVGISLNEKDWSYVRRALTLTAALISLLSILDVLGLGLSALFLGVSLSDLIFASSSFGGAYLLLALILGAHEFVRTEKGTLWRKILMGSLILGAASPLFINVHGLAGVFSDPTLLWGSARASGATLIAALLFVAGRWLVHHRVVDGSRRRALYVWDGAWVAAIFIALLLLLASGSFVQKAYIEESTSARIYVWEGAFNAFSERPLIGWGPEHFGQAFERHFDNRLYLGENYGEVWFDRAHNVVLDTLVTVGVVGIAAFLFLIFALIRTIIRARRSSAIGEWEAVLLLVFIVAHFLQLQTSFDGPGTYLLLAVFIGYVISLERGMTEKLPSIVPSVRIAGAVFLSALVVISMKSVVYDEWARQTALSDSLIAPEQLSTSTLFERSLARISDFESLRLSTTAYIRFSLQRISTTDDPTVVTEVRAGLGRYEEAYETYLAANPDNYRARMNYAYLLVVMTALGDDRREELQEVVDGSYELSPENPLTHVLDSITALYSGKLDRAKERIAAAVALNPDIVFTTALQEFIHKQIAAYPRLTLVRLENL